MLPPDQIKFLAGLFISAPLSFYIRKLPSPTIRYLYSFILGTALQLFVYGTDIWISFLMHFIIYAIIKIRGRKSGAIVTIFSIVFLSIYHIQRMVADYGSWVLDITTILMSSVCKYSLFAYSYDDGGKDKQKLTQQQQVYKMIQLPPIHKYLVFCQFLPTCIIGTTVQYKDFDDLMELREPFKNIKTDQIIKKIGFQLRDAIICAGIYITHVLVFPLTVMSDPSFVDQSVLYIIAYSFFSVTTIRFKYYTGWKLSQCAVHTSGISYDSKGQFNRVKTCNPWLVETTVHLRQKVANWNMSCQLWLRKCIYQRSPFKDKQISQAYTFAVSSIWHGFYGGYYISFLLWFLQINLAMKVFKFTQNNPKHFLITLVEKLGIVGDVILWLIVNILFSHNGLYFQILDSTRGWQILKRLYFVPGLIIVGGIYYFGSLGKRPRPPKVKESQQGKDNKKEQQKTKQN